MKRSEKDEKDARRFHALGHPVRLKLLQLIVKADGTMNVDTLVAALNLQIAPRSVKQPTVSHHLRIFCEAGLIEARRHHLEAYYVACPDAFAEIAQVLEGMRAIRLQEIAV